jgi:hypothetical protein
MRYYVTVHGGGEGAWIAEKAGEQIKQNALANLRSVRLHHAFDYEGFNILGVLMQRGTQFDLARIEQWVSLERGETGVRDNRLVVTNSPLAAGAVTSFGLVLEITAGERFGWESGRNGVNGVITVDKERRAAKVGAAMQDIFQDIMLANDDSIQSVLSKWRNGGGSEARLFSMKAAFAATEVAAGRAGALFAQFSADGYASFAAIARRNFDQTMNAAERAGFASLWTRFLVQEFNQHFLDVEEAVKLVTKGRFRNAKKGLNSEGAGQPDARILHGMLSEFELREVLSNAQLVHQDGSYILCFWLAKSPDSVDRLGPEFGWRDSHTKSPKKFKLVDDVGYAKMLPLVRDGLVTPIRLFLKKQ